MPLTCLECVYNVANINPQNKEIQKQCNRFPPTMHMIVTNQGIIAQTAYPVIADNFPSCGEYFDGIEDDLDKDKFH